LKIDELAFNRLRSAGEPGQPADVEELQGRARALGAFVTDPAHADCFHLIAPTGKRPKDIVQASPAIVQSVRVARRVTPAGGVAYDVVGEVTQSCTVKRGNEMFDVNGGCTVIVDPDGEIRYIISKRFDGDNRRDRQYAAIKGALKSYWLKDDGRWRPREGMLQRLHADRQ
jgi:hypothetical protein